MTVTISQPAKITCSKFWWGGCFITDLKSTSSLLTIYKSIIFKIKVQFVRKLISESQSQLVKY